MLDNQLLSPNCIITYTDNNSNVINIIRYYYDLGIRLIICTDTTADMLTIKNYIANKEDLIYINVTSTVPLNNLPKNIIRTSINDYDLLTLFLGNFLTNITSYINVKGSVLSEKLNDKYENFIFSDIAYIYMDGIYENSYLENILLINNNLNLYNITSFKIEDKLTDELISLLKENPVSSETYASSKKTLFIINAIDTEKMLNLFDDEKYYDNFFVFTDAFDLYSIQSKYLFNYTINPVSSSLELSKKLSNFFGYLINNQLLTIVDILQFIESFYDYIFNKKNKLDDMIVKLSSFFLNKEIEIYSLDKKTSNSKNYDSTHSKVLTLGSISMSQLTVSAVLL